jgi:hypothetical protein
MQNKEFLKTLRSGDIVIQHHPFDKHPLDRQMLVRDVRGDIIEIVPLEIPKETGQLLRGLGLPPDEQPFCTNFSSITGGVIDVFYGLDGHEPGPDHPHRDSWSVLISKA